MCVAQAQLFAMNTLHAEDHNQTEGSVDAKFSIPVALWIALGIVFGAVVVYLLIRFSGKIKSLFSRIRKKRYRRSRKRVR